MSAKGDCVGGRDGGGGERGQLGCASKLLFWLALMTPQFMIASHNQESVQFVLEEMHKRGIDKKST